MRKPSIRPIGCARGCARDMPGTGSARETRRRPCRAGSARPAHAPFGTLPSRNRAKPEPAPPLAARRCRPRARRLPRRLRYSPVWRLIRPRALAGSGAGPVWPEMLPGTHAPFFKTRFALNIASIFGLVRLAVMMLRAATDCAAYGMPYNALNRNYVVHDKA